MSFLQEFAGLLLHREAILPSAADPAVPVSVAQNSRLQWLSRSAGPGNCLPGYISFIKDTLETVHLALGPGLLYAVVFWRPPDILLRTPRFQRKRIT